MVLNIKSTVKISENLMAVIPRIISKDVQLLYTAFGRETNGKKKFNFSSTNTYKYLLGKYSIITYNQGWYVHILINAMF